jgi:hypothetical protein
MIDDRRPVEECELLLAGIRQNRGVLIPGVADAMRDPARLRG